MLKAGLKKMEIPEEAIAATMEQFSAMNPMKRLGTPNEIAHVALYLASSDSSYVMGIDLSVDDDQAMI